MLFRSLPLVPLPSSARCKASSAGLIGKCTEGCTISSSFSKVCLSFRSCIIMLQTLYEEKRNKTADTRNKNRYRFTFLFIVNPFHIQNNGRAPPLYFTECKNILFRERNSSLFFTGGDSSDALCYSRAHSRRVS